jgi:hypothetical protein
VPLATTPGRYHVQDVPNGHHPAANIILDTCYEDIVSYESYDCAYINRPATEVFIFALF